MPRPSFPKTLRQFQSDFATEEACQRYLAACRWPDGFICPRCGHGKAYELLNQRRQQCCVCRYQVSLTSGTILHRTKVPLTHWFWAAYLMTTDKRGVSALLLQRQLGLTCYETAWMMLHKLRRAMVNTAREPLYGEVEVDETWIGGEQAGLRGSRRSALAQQLSDQKMRTYVPFDFVVDGTMLPSGTYEVSFDINGSDLWIQNLDKPNYGKYVMNTNIMLPAGKTHDVSGFVFNISNGQHVLHQIKVKGNNHTHDIVHGTDVAELPANH